MSIKLIKYKWLLFLNFCCIDGHTDSEGEYVEAEGVDDLLVQRVGQHGHGAGDQIGQRVDCLRVEERQQTTQTLQHSLPERMHAELDERRHVHQLHDGVVQALVVQVGEQRQPRRVLLAVAQHLQRRRRHVFQHTFFWDKICEIKKYWVFCVDVNYIAGFAKSSWWCWRCQIQRAQERFRAADAVGSRASFEFWP